MKNKAFKIAILNDIIEAELGDLPINNIIDPIAKSKYRNYNKTAQSFTSYTNTLFTDEGTKLKFGELCDKINEFIDETLKNNT